MRPLLADDPRLGIDTEFIRERTYAPVLEIVQISAGGGEFITLIDVPALGGELGPLKETLLDPAILKIVHAGSQDVEILTERLGAMPGPLYDTQVAAAFAGFGLQTGYGALVQAALKVTISKEEGFSDWSRRPLTAAMQTYAENDVRHLPTLHEKLAARLERTGRVTWAQEQMDRVLFGAAEVTSPEELWRKVGGRASLSSRELAILRELALWRDEEAQRRNKPRRSVIKDEPLVELARRKPQNAAAVLALRGMPPNLGERAAGALAEAVVRGLAVPAADCPRPENLAPLDDQGGALMELLSAVVKIRAMEENLPPSLLASGDDLRALATARRNGAFEGPLFSGWRGALIGEALRATLEGRLSVSWDATKGRLTARSKE